MAGAEILVIGNPRRKRRTMTARQRMFFGKRRTSHARRNPTSKRRRSHTRRRTTHVRRNPVMALPRSKRRSVRTYARNFRRRHASKIATTSGFINGALIPASIGAAGALALDIAWAKLPIPATLKTGPMAPVVRIAGAIGVGFAVGAVGGKRMGEQAMAGALTVTAYDIIKGYLTANVPALGLSAYPRMGAYPRMSYVNAGAVG